MSAAGPAIVGGLATAAGMAAAASRRGRGQQKRGQLIDLQAFENELGVQAPVGFFDPLNFTGDGDVEDFRRRRETELKNGRVAMFATMGYIVPEYFRFPGFLSPSAGLKFADMPNGLKALDKVPTEGWLQIIALGGFYELVVNQPQNPNEPGNYGRGKFGFTGESISDPEQRKRCLNAELANGRLAMMAIIGMFFQDGLTGSAWGDWANYTDSPLRAVDLSTELGACPPLGFWDPLDLSKFEDPDVAAFQFKRRRVIELQHGRVSMLACIGYIVPEYFKWPGYLSPSEELKFEDIPNGLGAFEKVPFIGWVQILAFVGLIEVFNLQSEPKEYPGDYELFGAFGIPGGGSIEDTEKKEKSLLAEINNGRLAMMAIIGMFFQNGLTGSAWGDWANYTASPLRAFEFELGAQAPLGFWDPLGLSADGDEQKFKRRRAIEFKHGRVSMLACMGYIFPEYGKFPGYLSPSQDLKFADIPNGLAAISKVPTLGWVQVLCFAGFIEGKDGLQWNNENPGDIGWKVITSKDPEMKAKKLAADLSNGRLAMFAIIGMFFQDGLTGSAWGDWDNYVDSPLRAFESELGVQAPVGFWDPLGLSADGDVATFRRRRTTEIKHGRISMLATMGYITPEITGKFPGYLSNSLDLKFEDIPNGLAAVSKVPGAGWLQIVAYALYCEATGGFGYNSDNQASAPGDCGWKPPLLATDDPELKTKRLNAELANGRLAMMAIIGMFFQDGLTGSAWGDWANYTDSPLRAFEDELGAQAPVGFFDPLGLSKDGDADVFRRRRESEIKHGRISMIAAIGFITTSMGYRFPGFLSPSTGVKFEDVPNGLEAISKVPALGWIQWFIFCGLVDFGLYRQDPARAPGDFENGGILGVPNASGPMSDAEGRKRKLNSELANGRLAMVAIMGMLFQNGWTGTSGEGMWGF